MKIVHMSVVARDHDITEIYKAFTELAAGIEQTWVNESINLGLQPYDNEPDAEEPEVLTYDENTMPKVYRAFYDSGFSEDTATEIVGRMQNAGILFRERP